VRRRGPPSCCAPAIGGGHAGGGRQARSCGPDNARHHGMERRSRWVSGVDLFRRTIPDFRQGSHGSGGDPRSPRRMQLSTSEIDRFILATPGGHQSDPRAGAGACRSIRARLDHERDVIRPTYGKHVRRRTVLFVAGTRPRAKGPARRDRSLNGRLGPGFTASCVAAFGTTREPRRDHFWRWSRCSDWGELVLCPPATTEKTQGREARSKSARKHYPLVVAVPHRLADRVMGLGAAIKT